MRGVVGRCTNLVEPEDGSMPYEALTLINIAELEPPVEQLGAGQPSL